MSKRKAPKFTIPQVNSIIKTGSPGKQRTKKKKSIFVLYGSKGSWDSHYTFTVGVFDTIELAEQEKAKFIEELTILSKKYTPEQAKALEEEYRNTLCLIHEDEEGNTDEYYSDEVLEYLPWQFRHKLDSFNFDEIKIVEYPLNQIHFKINEA